MLALFCRFALIGLVLSTAVFAESVGEAEYWSDGSLKSYTKSLAPKLNEQHYAIENLGDFGSHFVLMVYREASGPAELHDGQTDFYVVQEGSGTLHVGGEIVDAKTTDPGEIRGTSIRGGKTKALHKGDTVNIPPATPHQVVLKAGEKITYLIVKVHKR